MEIKSRVASILKANSLDFSITGLQTFNLSELNLLSDLDFQLPTNVRLGHLAEVVVSELIKSSTNYEVVYENIQLIEGKKTIGEIDFIIKDKNTEQLIHMELAYKFYLYDPEISSKEINNWIGPNRNDSLKNKLDKVKNKQFPLLYHKNFKSRFDKIEIGEVSQALCLLVSLFIPYKYKISLDPIYEKAVQGYYLNMDTLTSFNHVDKKYYLPLKKEWGMNPSENEIWTAFNNIEENVNMRLKEKQSLLCWQKHGDSYLSFFIVWW